MDIIAFLFGNYCLGSKLSSRRGGLKRCCDNRSIGGQCKIYKKTGLLQGVKSVKVMKIF